MAAEGPGDGPALAMGVADQDRHPRPRHPLGPGGQQLSGHRFRLDRRVPAHHQRRGGRVAEPLGEGHLDGRPRIVCGHHGHAGPGAGPETGHGLEQPAQRRRSPVVVVDQHMGVAGEPGGGQVGSGGQQAGAVDVALPRQRRGVALGEAVELGADAWGDVDEGGGHLLGEGRSPEEMAEDRPVGGGLCGQQPPDRGALLRGREEADAAAGPGDQVERHAEPGGEGQGVEPVGQAGEHSVAEAAGRGAVGTDDQHRGRAVPFLDQAQVAGDEGRRLTAAGPTGDPQATVVLHDPALGSRQFHDSDSTDALRQLSSTGPGGPEPPSTRSADRS